MSAVVAAKNIIPLPKSTHERFMAANLQVYDFEVSDSDMKVIDTLPYCGGLHFDPDSAWS